MKLLMSSQGAALPLGLQGQSRPWGSLGRISVIKLVAGWGTSIGGAGRILAIPNNRLVN
jgi:hypothetical protein